VFKFFLQNFAKYDRSTFNDYLDLLGNVASLTCDIRNGSQLADLNISFV